MPGCYWGNITGLIEGKFPPAKSNMLVSDSQTGQSWHVVRVDVTTHSPGMYSRRNTTSLYFYQGGTWPESNAPSQCGTTPTPAVWRCWTIPSRSKEVWRVWRMSWRRWPMPSAFCHDDSSHCLCTTLLLFASCPHVLCNLCQGWYVPLPVLFPHLECAFPWITAFVDVGW